MAGRYSCLGREKSQISQGEGDGWEKGMDRGNKQLFWVLCNHMWLYLALLCIRSSIRQSSWRRWIRSLEWAIWLSRSLHRKRGCVTLFIIVPIRTLVAFTFHYNWNWKCAQWRHIDFVKNPTYRKKVLHLKQWIYRKTAIKIFLHLQVTCQA